MADQHKFNLGAWLSRLGFTGGLVPPFRQEIQPVQVVGDASTLVPPLLDGLSWFGGVVAGAAAQYSWFRVRCGALGGAYVRTLVCRPGVGVVVLLVIDDATGAAAGGLWSEMPQGPVGCRSTVEQGTTAVVLSPNNYPSVGIIAGTQLMLFDQFYLKHGQTLMCYCTTANTTIYGAIQLQECPALETD